MPANCAWYPDFKIESTGFSFAGGTVPNVDLVRFQTLFNFSSAAIFNAVKEARNLSIPSLAVFKREPESFWEIAYDYLGRRIWRRRGSPVIVDVSPISPIFFPTIITNRNSPRTKIGNLLTSSDSNMFGNSTRKSPRGTSPKVPRSPRGSPRMGMRSPRMGMSPRMSPRMGRRGGYYEKYMKYKAKYLDLKAKLGK